VRRSASAGRSSWSWAGSTRRIGLRSPATGTKRHLGLHRETFAGRWAARLAEQPPPEASAEDAALARFRRHAFVMDATLLTPDQDSGSLRMFHVLRLLRGFGYHVTFVPFDGSRRDRYVAQLRRWGIDVVVPPHLRSVEELLEERGWRQDLCLLSRPDVAERWLDPLRLLCPRATILYDTVDLHFLRRAREVAVRGTSNLPESQREQELRAARRADAVVVVSEVDRDLLLAEDPALRVHVLSNVHELRPTRTSFAEREGILFIGGFRHAPNADAVLWFVREVLPLVHHELPELRFHVIGSEIPPEVRALASERVVIEGYVPDVMPFFERCRLSVAPLRYGAGVKGKINQSMSHGVPCVATSVATEGMELSPGEDVLVADDADRFAARVVELYRDEALWTRLAANALRNVERVFSVDVARARLQAILREHGLD
jgi:glycosyltransferase involved in cell wall biosynthesis